MNTAFIQYLAALLLFATNGIVASQIDLASYEIVLTRTWLAFLVLLAACLVTREKAEFFRYKKDTAMLLLCGVTMGIGWSLLYEAYVYVGVSIATLLIYIGPMIVLATGPFLFGEKWTRPLVVSVIMVVCGMLCLNDITAGGVLHPWGLFCGALSAVTYASKIILGKKAMHLPKLSATLLTLMGACAVVTVFVLVKQGALPTISEDDYLPIFILGAVNTGLGYCLYFPAIRCLPVRTVSVCGYIEAIAAVVFSMLLLGESLSLVQLIGGALILGGSVYCEYRARHGQGA